LTGRRSILGMFRKRKGRFDWGCQIRELRPYGAILTGCSVLMAQEGHSLVYLASASAEVRFGAWLGR